MSHPSGKPANKNTEKKSRRRMEQVSDRTNPQHQLMAYHGDDHFERK